MKISSTTQTVLQKTGSKPLYSRLQLFSAFTAFFMVLAVLWRATPYAYEYLGEHSANEKLHDITVGKKLLRVPENHIRSAQARRDGQVDKLRLYLRWPHMTGYSHADQRAFNHLNKNDDIVFLSIETIENTQFKPVELELLQLAQNEGQMAEITQESFATVCEEGAVKAIQTTCQRSIAFDHDLVLVYRFPQILLREGAELDKKITELVTSFLVSLDE